MLFSAPHMQLSGSCCLSGEPRIGRAPNDTDCGVRKRVNQVLGRLTTQAELATGT